MKNNYKLVKIIGFGLALVFVALQMFVAVNMTVNGSELARIETEEQKLAIKNSLLQKGVANYSSLNRISEGASNLGYTKPEETWYLNQNEAVAANIR
jgi:hypothetical protein